MIIITTSISYSEELLDLAQIDINEIKHSSQKDLLMFKLAKLKKMS